VVWLLNAGELLVGLEHRAGLVATDIENHRPEILDRMLGGNVQWVLVGIDGSPGVIARRNTWCRENKSDLRSAETWSRCLEVKSLPLSV
jgi:hypothetical protein